MRLAAIAALALSACASLPSEDEAARQITRITDVVHLGNDRLRIDIEKPLLMGVEDMEYAALARAASEAMERGAPAFAIVKADYGQRLAFLSRDMAPLGSVWIGSYEDLLAEREREADQLGRITAASFVVKLEPEGGSLLRETFDAEETYSALLDAWIDRNRL